MFSKFRVVRTGLIFSLALFMGLFLACTGGSTPPPVPTATAPTITAQPQNQTAVAGTTASFSVTATGTGTLSYQWKKNATDIAGQTSANLSLAAVSGSDAATYTVVVTNTQGGATASTTSAAATLAVNQPPVISALADRTAVAGTDVTFTANATSANGTLSYQWKKNGTDISGKTASTLSFTPATLADAGNYSVQVTNTLNATTTNATSNSAALAVNPAPTAPVIAAHPTSQTIVSGNPVTFSVNASASSGVLSYQWRKGGAAIVGETAATYTIPSVQAANAGSFDVLVTSSLSGVSLSTPSNAAVLSVNVPPAIDTHPLTQTLVEGNPVSLSVHATTGAGTLSYQWKKAGVDISGKNAQTLDFTSLTLADAGSYTVLVTNTLNGTTTTTLSSAAVLTVNPAPATPAISAQPLTQSVLEGGSVTLSVTASASNGTLSYQWKKGGTDLVGKTASSLTLNPVLLTDAGSYTVAVINSLSGTTATTLSAAAVLTVNPIATAPVIGTQPLTQTVTEGANVNLTVAATGNGTLSYQWKKAGVDIGGQTSNTLAFAPVALTDAGSYTVLVTNSLNGTTATTLSSAAVLTVNSAPVAPTITTQPLTQVMTAPDSPTFTVVASGSGLTYQWRKNGTDISGANAASYTVPGFTDLQTVPDSYTVVVGNGAASVESNSVTFSVVAPNPFYLPGGEPVPVPSRPLTVLPSLHVDAVKFPNGAFRFGYDEALKNPAWTAYGDFKVNTTYANGGGDYQTDTRLQVPQVGKGDMGAHGTTPGFYLTNGQGFDRGHMAMRSDVSYRYGSQAGDDATYMSNLVPQVSYYNQRIWNDLEEAVGGKLSGSTFTNGLTATFGRVWVYTGPVFTGTVNHWVPSTETYTTNRAGVPAGTLAIAIPTACYKIMVVEPTQGQTLPRVMAWISSNRSYTSGESSDIWKYVTSVKRIEDLTGLDFFPSLTHDSNLTALKASVDVRGWGTTFEKATGPNVHIVQPSWDLIPISGNPVLTGDTVQAGATVTFEAAVSPNKNGGTVDPATGCTWTFTDGSPTTTGLTTNHVFSSTGSYTVTFSATDSLSQTNTISRVITVVGVSANTPPTFTPSTLPDVTVTAGTAIPSVTFSLGDDSTTPGNLLVTATSSNTTLLLDSGLVPTNTNGNVSMTVTPNAGQTGTAIVTMTATDGDGASTVKTFTLTINANNPPTFTPSTLADAGTTMNTAKSVNFTVADDRTAAGSLVVNATSNNPTLLPNANIAVANVAGAITLTLTPAAGQVGSALVTVVATDGDAANTTKTFTLTVTSGSLGPKLIISQYYCGTGNNKWIEITNIGDAAYDASVSPVYACQWNNPRTSNTHKGLLVSGTINVGQSVLIRNSSATAPVYAYNGGAATTTDNVRVISDTGGLIMGFNGNDVVYLSAALPSSTTDTVPYTNRLDVIGDYTSATDTSSVNWDPSPLPTPPAGFNASDLVGQYRSFVRLPTVTAQKQVFDPTQWTQVDSVRIAAATPSAVDTAAVDSTNRLGVHVFNH